MKSSIEKLVLWLIPAEFLSVILRGAFDYFSAGQILNPAHTSLVSTFSFLSGISYLVANLVIAVWLFQQNRHPQSGRWIWCVFGLVAGLWALAIYLLVQLPSLLRSVQKQSENQQS